MLISILAYGGLLVPLPLAPVAFVTSVAVLIIARKEYVRAAYEGHPDDTIFKLMITMVLCLGNILATVMLGAVLIFALIIWIPRLLLYT